MCVGVNDENRKAAMDSEPCNVVCICLVLYFSRQKGFDSEKGALCQLKLHYFGHIKDSFFVLEVKVCLHYRRIQNPTQPSSVLQAQFYVMNGAHFWVEIFCCIVQG